MMPQIIMNESNHQIIEVGEKRYYFSYMTCVAFADFSKGIRVRRKSNYSKTTARHMSRHMSNMGVKMWDSVEDAMFEQMAAL